MRLRATGIDDSGDLDVDVDGIVFDKDGTLIDLDATWAPITAAMLDAVVVEAVGASASDDAIEQLRDQYFLGLNICLRQPLCHS